MRCGKFLNCLKVLVTMVNKNGKPIRKNQPGEFVRRLLLEVKSIFCRYLSLKFCLNSNHPEKIEYIIQDLNLIIYSFRLS